MAVIRRTTGSAINSTGKATTHDTNQADSHLLKNAGEAPMPFKVLIIDTTQVMRMDNSKGITRPAKRAGNLGMPNTMVSLEAFMGCV